MALDAIVVCELDVEESGGWTLGKGGLGAFDHGIDHVASLHAVSCTKCCVSFV